MGKGDAPRDLDAKSLLLSNRESSILGMATVRLLAPKGIIQYGGWKMVKREESEMLVAEPGRYPGVERGRD